MHTHPHQGHSHAAGGGRDARAGHKKRLALTLVLIAAYMAAEVVGGLLTNSLALLADAGHMLSDVAALALALFALWIAQRPPTPQRTYGYYRAEILAALVNGATLVAIAIYIFIEAYQRLREPPVVQGPLMMGIATGGLAVNLVALWILNAGKSESLNLRGAWLHVLADALGSVAAITAGALIWAFQWHWVDPLVSVVIGLLVIQSSWSLLKESVAVLMEGAPRGIDVDEVRDALRTLPGSREVHDLHVWSITSGMVALSAHIVVEDGRPQPELLKSARGVLHERFGIDHVTLQLEATAECDHCEAKV